MTSGGTDPMIVVCFRDTTDHQRLEFGSGDSELLRALAHPAISLLFTLDEDGCIEIDVSIGSSVTTDHPTAVQRLAQRSCAAADWYPWRP